MLARILPLMILLAVPALAPFAVPAQAFADDGDDKGDDDKDDDDKDDGDKDDGDKDDGDKDKDKKDAKREIDKESPEAQALGELLFVPPNYGKKDKRVELNYPFAEEAEMEDFSFQGFDRSEVNGDLELTVGSQREGLMVHALHMKGDYEVEYEVSVEWMAPSSVVVFALGKAKSGGMWGNGWCKRTSRGFKPVSGKVARLIKESRAAFNGARTVKINIKVKNEVATCTVNGRSAGDTTKLKKKLDGPIGIYMKNARLRVTRITIKGEIDASKL